MGKKIAFIFPGQGSQFVGMGKDFSDKFEKASGLFKKADEIIGSHFSNVCFNGPEEDLKKTANTQPGLFVSSIAAYEYLKSNGILPDAVAGHSLGEYSALYAAGVFDFETGINLVKERGKAMNIAAEKNPGTMAALMGISIDKVEELCAEASSAGIVKPANFNSPEQIVISGDAAGVGKAMELAKQKGAKRALPLPVHGAFHSPLMDNAAEEMKKVLLSAKLNDAGVTFVNNADAKIIKDSESIKDSLSRQITSCVKWVDIINLLSNETGIEVFIEVGPGKVLSGLVKRIAPSKTCYNAGTIEEANKIIQERSTIL